MTRAAPLLLAVVLAFGCGDATPYPTFSVRDSAGVAIAENTGPVPEPGGWALSPEPILQIGTVEGEDAYLFGRIRGIVRLSDGRIAVADDRAAELRIFDPAGRHLRTMGRKGDGPGEFEGPQLMGVLPGDTLVVVDASQRRISLFHPDGGFIRSATASDDVPGYLLPAGMLASGAVLDARTVYAEGTVEGYARRPIEYRVVGLDGEVSGALDPLPGYETVQALMSEADGTAMVTGQAPFGKSPAGAVAGDRLYYGSQDVWEIRVYRPDGSLAGLIRWDREPEPVTEEQVAAFIEDAVSDLPDNSLAQRYRRFYHDAPIPDLHPAHGSVFADRLGWLWVEETRVSDDLPHRWVLVDPEGRVAGSIDLPARFRLADIGSDYVLGRWVDELGVDYIRLYGLTRPE